MSDPMLAGAFEVIGRERELAQLTEFVKVGGTQSRVFVIAGEAGIGKSSLWRVGLSAAEEARSLVLKSAPTEPESALAYAVLGDLLDPLPSEAMAALSDPLRSALEVALFRAPVSTGVADQLAVSTAVLRLLRQLADDRPVLLAIDDLQWCDSPSLRVLAFALRRLEDRPVRMLAALRLPTLSDLELVVRRAAGDSELLHLELGPLPEAAIDDLLLQRLRRSLRPPELRHVRRVSAGNPFFALEIGRFIAEHPEALSREGQHAVPASLADLLRDRLSSLSPPAQEVLLAMSALSRPDSELLAAFARETEAALDEAARAEVIERGSGRLRFTHPLLASVIYSLTDAVSRRELHVRLADLVNEPEERARHLALSATGPNAKVAEALETAARAANGRGAADGAAQLARQAWDLTPSEDNEARERRRILTADYLMRAGDVPEARRLLEEMLREGPESRRPIEALRLMGTLTLGGEDLVAAERYLTEALARARENPDAEMRVLRDLVRVFIQQGKHDQALHYGRRFREVAEAAGDEAFAAVAWSLIASSQTRLEPTSREAREFAVALAEDRVRVPLPDGAGGLHPLMEWAVLLKFTDDFAHARALFKRILTLTEGRDESIRAPVLFHFAEMECWAGDWNLAAFYARECEKSVIHTGHDGYFRLSLNARALLHCCRGEFDEARVAAREAVAVSQAVGDEPYLRRGLATLGATELAAGDAAAANAIFDSLRVRGRHERYIGVVRSEGDEAEALIAAGRFAEAGVVADWLSRATDPWPLVARTRIRALTAAAEGDIDASLTAFERALEAHAALEMPLERARTLLAYGQALRRGKRKRPARERLESALAEFRRLGAAAWARRAESELERTGAAAAGISLTPTESRVADLVAAGRTNKEVAAQLFMSVKTVEANLSRVYGKLGVRSRTELAATISGRSS